MLTGRQIERYSRQIITQGFSGTAQERLLSANITVAGRLDELDPLLPYLVGAGVGTIRLDTEADTARVVRLEERFRDLNPDVEFVEASQTGDRCDLLLTAGSDREIAGRIRDLATRHAAAAIIFARLAPSPTIAVIPSRPPCLLCTDAGIDLPFDGVCENPGLVAMIAGLEAIKLLAGIAPAGGRLIEFDRYTMISRPLRQHTDTVSCGCK
ncbi:MAG TPA: hypothetical protein VMU41_02420 [Candidatus Binataceae bacterium]|nr:hypothetical protein [Candidatus Binataceae bacterium]